MALAQSRPSMAKKKSKPKRGRPPEGRVPLMVHIKPQTVTLVDGMVVDGDRDLNTRGKIIECAMRRYTLEP